MAGLYWYQNKYRYKIYRNNTGIIENGSNLRCKGRISYTAVMILPIPFLSPSDVPVIFKECIKVEVISATDFGCLNILKRLLMVENMFDLSMTYIHGFVMTKGVLWYNLSTLK
jgi:hypothetical protein